MIPADRIEDRILLIRGERAIIDADLAAFYGVPTRRLNEQVRRNAERFPADFAFRLTSGEKAEVIANCDHLHKLRYAKALPLAFTEYGAIMAASLLNSPRAVAMAVFVVRAFVNLRRQAISNHELAAQLGQLEARLTDHDKQLAAVVRALRSLMAGWDTPKNRQIGFAREE